MKRLLLLAASALTALSADTRGAATVLLNNYDSHMLIYLADGRTLAPTDGSVYVQLLGGPSADQMNPVTILSSYPAGKSTTTVSEMPGLFDAGIGIVPGVADNATATLQLEAWQGGPNPAGALIAKTPIWTQATGRWSVSDLGPPSGTWLQIPTPIVLPVPEPSTMRLGLLAVAAWLVAWLRGTNDESCFPIDFFRRPENHPSGDR